MAVPIGSSIHVYRTDDCELLHDLGSHIHKVTALAFSSDGLMLVSGSGDGTIMLWDLGSGRLLVSVQGHTSFDHLGETARSWISGLSFSSDDRYLASGGWNDGAIRIWGILPPRIFSLFDFFTENSMIYFALRAIRRPPYHYKVAYEEAQSLLEKIESM